MSRITRNRSTWVGLLPCLILAGCGGSEFSGGKIQYRLETEPIQLDGEQVMMNRGQVDCGVTRELWDLQELGKEDRQVAHLTDAARALGFSDDIQIGEPGFINPYAQIRGKFMVTLLDMGSVKDEGPRFKLVETKLGIKIDHECFANPLPVLMGVRHGKFTQTAYATVRFRLDDNWYYDQIVH